ncbi:hypothetical protein LSUB1_G007001 [Lachnellula subtilissima]|uniref:DUF7907 domain-containing protein n=1 Tax=Lachnellula subtilissima TaxID=602034 RepID=A0A8H8RKS0_9HELO|nr:hypothetical protein LSUB1_G007001 [Lachnellula subtilissima]
MRGTIIAGTLAFVAGVNAQYYTNQSAPFNLVLTSQNTTLNGSTLGSCHEGAAIEGLCVAGNVDNEFTGPLNSDSGAYTFNYTTTQATEPTGVNVTGLLTWLLVGGNFETSSPMQLDPVPTSNVAVPLLEPSEEGQLVAFDADNKLVIMRTVDDTQPLPNYSSKALSNWYACTTDSGYLYQTLAWVVGTETAVPQNPTCQKVEVVRVFV